MFSFEYFFGMIILGFVLRLFLPALPSFLIIILISAGWAATFGPWAIATFIELLIGWGAIQAIANSQMKEEAKSIQTYSEDLSSSNDSHRSFDAKPDNLISEVNNDGTLEQQIKILRQLREDIKEAKKDLKDSNQHGYMSDSKYSVHKLGYEMMWQGLSSDIVLRLKELTKKAGSSISGHGTVSERTSRTSFHLAELDRYIEHILSFLTQKQL